MSEETYPLLGKNFVPPDVVGKVTGKAKYAEDFRRDNMLFCRLYLSPMPHGKVKNIDASEALKMKGVVAVLTADDVPSFPAPEQPILTNEPKCVGDPILAVAAENETLAQDALEKIRVDIEPLPFTLDPLESLYPGGPDARTDGNVAGTVNYTEPFLKTVKWDARDFARAKEGELPMGEAVEDWSYGDVAGGFDQADYVLEESFVTASLAHHSMEPRSCLAYWENGKCHVYGSCQSQSFPVPFLARYIGIKPEELVFIAEFCGGGFGSKGSAYPAMSIPAHMAKKVQRPVMMRISRHEEYFIGSARPGFQRRIKMGFRKDGRLLAVDLYIVHENGAYIGFNDYHAAGEAVSLVYQPEAMRFRGIPVQTNTPYRGPQRGPGQNQIASAVEPLLDKAARELGIDQVIIRKINAPAYKAGFGAKQKPVTSSYMEEAIAMGMKEFDWQNRKQLSGKRTGTKVTGVGVGQAYHSAGATGFDGLVVITPDGKLHIRCRQSGHILPQRHIPGGRGDTENELGSLRHRAGRFAQAPALEPGPVRQQYVLHYDPDQLCGGHGRGGQAEGHRRRGTGRGGRGLRHR